MAKREFGRIKWWNKDRGFGFAEFAGYKEDVFIHITKFLDKSIKSDQIKDNDEIECEVIKGGKGLEGKNVSYSGVKLPLGKDEFKGKFYIPKDSNDVIDSDLNGCENLNLLLNKFPIFDENMKADIKSNYKYISNKKWKENYEHISKVYLERIRKLLDDFRSENYLIEKRKYELNWRLAIGIGEASVYETSIKLHYIYGFPFIPASTFKGTIRSWVINNYFDGKEDKALNDEFISYVFGSPKKDMLEEQGGNIIFFDVNPICYPNIELDIINTHYSDYYQNGMASPPGDYSNPNLVNFLTVNNTIFEFNYGYDSNFDFNSLKNTKFQSNICEVINKWIDEALNYQGIGAKTSVGYGYFTNKA